ncbi:hypothetical protein HTG_04390 [Natrinema mahii]|nr:hypothetical protein HTG_04390 [Natrinema mahii]
MREKDNQGKVEINRRNALKSAAVGIASLGSFSLVGSAKSNHGQSFDEIYEQARKIRRETGKQERFVDFLESQGCYVKSNSKDIPVYRPKEANDGISVQRLEKDHFSSDMTLTYYQRCLETEAYVDYSIDISENQWIVFEGEPGPDEITISWNGDHYRIDDGSWYSEGENVSYKSSQLSGINWEVDDNSLCGKKCNESIAVGTRIELLETDQERAVRGKYHHTWNEEEYSGFGVSTAGSVVWSYAPTEHSWEGAYETREDSDAVRYRSCK